MTTIFTDGFESGDFSAWTSTLTSGTGSAVTVSAGAKNTGSFGADINKPNGANGGYARVVYNFSAPGSNIVTVDFWMRVVSAGTDGILRLMAFRSEGTVSNEVTYVQYNNGTYYFEIRNKDGTTQNTAISNIGDGSWHRITYSYDCSGSNPVGTCYVDGSQSGSTLTDSTTGSVVVPTRLWMQANEVSWTAAGECYYDDVTLSDALPVFTASDESITDVYWPDTATRAYDARLYDWQQSPLAGNVVENIGGWIDANPVVTRWRDELYSFAFDSVNDDYLDVFDSDSFSASDDSSISADLSDTEAFSADEVTSLTVSLADTDSGSAVEGAALDASITSSDSVSGADSGSVSTGTNPTSSDTFTVSESASVAVSLTSADTFTAADAATLNAGLTSADGSAVTDAHALNAALTSADSGAVTEASNLNASISGADSGAASEGTPAFGLTGADAFTVTEAASIAASLTSSDTASGTDSGSVNTGSNPSSADTFTVTETASISATLTSTDTFTASDASSMNAAVSSADSGAVTEASNLNASISGADSGSASEATSLNAGLTSADSAAAVEARTLNAALTGADTASLTEGAPTLNAALTSTDSASGTDAGSVGTSNNPTSSDTFTVTETASITASLSSADSFGALEQSILAAALSGADVIVITEGGAVAAMLSASDALLLLESGWIETRATFHFHLESARANLLVLSLRSNVAYDSAREPDVYEAARWIGAVLSERLNPAHEAGAKPPSTTARDCRG